MLLCWFAASLRVLQTSRLAFDVKRKKRENRNQGRKERKKTYNPREGWEDEPREGWEDGTPPTIVGGGLPGLRGFSVATIVIGKAFRVILIDGARLASSE